MRHHVIGVLERKMSADQSSFTLAIARRIRTMTRNLKISILGIYQITILATCLAQRYIGERCKDDSGANGICQVVSECPAALQGLRRGKIPVTCGFQNSSPIVCCANQSGNVATRRPGETAEKWCQRYLGTCTTQLIIVGGGEKAGPNEFPHMAAIGYGEPNKIKWSCGGTLISEKFVLTAAHCLHSGLNGPAKWVLLGTELLINTTLPDGRKGQIHPVERRIKHPDYKPPSKYHDVALLEIGTAVTPNPKITFGRIFHPACLPTNDKKLNESQAIVTGWGAVGFGENGSPDLMKAEIDVLQNSICNKSFETEIKTTNWLKRGIAETMICAGVLAGGRDTCKGDSGGPLQTLHDESCVYVVWGITSFGKACTYENSPAVYTRVSEYIPWIENIVWP